MEQENLTALILSLKEGDKSAFDRIYALYVGKIYNFIRNLSNDTFLAEEITQEVFIKLWRRRLTIDEGQGVSAWLFACARNMFLNEIRHRKHTAEYMAEMSRTHSDDDFSTVDAIDAHFTEKNIAEMVNSMPPRRREIFILSRRDSLSAAQIAERLQISERTVESQLYMARKFLGSIKDKS